MQISPQILRLALLRVFAEAESERLEFAQVSSLWPRTGLRQSDLRDAVRELLDSGDLLGSGADDTLQLALSPQGLGALREPYGELQVASFDDEAALFMARHRERAAQMEGMRRRAVD